MIVRKVALSLVVLAGSGAYVWMQSGTAAPDPLAAAPIDDLQTGSIAPRASVPLPLKPSGEFETTLPALSSTRPAEEPGAEQETDDPNEPDQEHRSPAAQIPASQEPPPAPVQAAPVPSSPAFGATWSPAPIEIVKARLPRPRPAGGAPADFPLAVPVAASGGARRQYLDGVYTGPVTDAYYGLLQIQAVVQGGRLSDIRVLRYPSDRRTSVRINRQALPMLRNEAVAAQSAHVDIITGATLTSEAFIRSLGGAMQQASSST